MSTRKSDRDWPIVPPIDFHPPSNGEFCPTPPDGRARRAHELWYRDRRGEAPAPRHDAPPVRGERVRHRRRALRAQRLWLERRDRSDGAGGVLAAAAAGRRRQRERLGSGGSGGGVRRLAGRPLRQRELRRHSRHARRRGCRARPAFGQRIHLRCSDARFDPARAWTEKTPPERALDFIKQIFVQSDTTVACVSGIPAARNLDVPGVEATPQVKEIIERLGGPRLIMHANADPELGPSELDYMADVTSRFRSARSRCIRTGGRCGSTATSSAAVHRSGAAARRARDRRPPRHQRRRGLRGRGVAGRRGARGEEVPEREFLDLPLGLGARRRREPAFDPSQRRIRPASTA